MKAAILMLDKKFIIALILALSSFPVCGQIMNPIDAVVSEIYNLDFQNVSAHISEIEKTDPQIAGYLRFDFLWWKMISENSLLAESEFVTYKNGFLLNSKDTDKEFKTLIFYLYQIRYENLKKNGFSKYFTAVRCHLYLQKLNDQKVKELMPLERVIFQLIVEFDKCLRFKYLNNFSLSSDRNNQQFQASLDKIDRLQDKQNCSFEAIKTYFLGKIYLEIENDTLKAQEKFSRLANDYPGNWIFKSIKSECQSRVFIGHH